MASGISVVIAARNEAAQIGACIGSVSNWCDEVIVVDDHSTDETALRATAAGATVIRLADRIFSPDPSRGRVEQVFRIGFEHAQGRYILRIDADERPSPALLDRLVEIANANVVNGVRVARRYYFFGEWLRGGGWFQSEQLAFFRSDAWDRSWPTAIHQQVLVNEPVMTLPATEQLSIAHYDYATVEEFTLRSLVSYASQDGVHRASNQVGPYRPSLLWRPLKRGLGRYLLRRGYRDGTRGAVVAALLAAYEICAEGFAWEASQEGKETPGSYAAE